ncbi:hypothetical protein JXA34_03775 [Patescibacteria group bacterium]|nr:hypothetical protein [Patescibacteria group bacterium]
MDVSKQPPVTNLNNQGADDIPPQQAPSKPAEPKNPEGYVPSFETYTPSEVQEAQEVQKAPETEPKPVSETPQPKKLPEPQTISLDTEVAQEELNIVDKTEKVTELHEIKTPKDKITDRADADEEKFIQEVEAAHGHK